MPKDYVVVLGGMNLDLAGFPKGHYREKDSNIGEIEMHVGGVGHNIARNLTQLEVPTYLISVFGDDYFGNIIYHEVKKSDIHLDHVEKIAGAKSSIYLYVTDDQGDMVTAINDMRIVEAITPEFLAKKIDFINNARLCVLDANLSQESMEWLADHAQVPLLVDPVSVAKAERLQNVLDQIDTIKPNEHEIACLTGIKVTGLATAKQAAKKLNQRGVKNVFISLGARGILCSRKEEQVLIPPIAKKIVSTNGAGDTTMAALVWTHYLYGEVLSLKEIGLLTQSAAAINLGSAQAVSPQLNVKNIIQTAQTYQDKMED